MMVAVQYNILKIFIMHFSKFNQTFLYFIVVLLMNERDLY